MTFSNLLSLNEEETVKSLSPSNIANYLKSTGWKNIGAYGDNALRFGHNNLDYTDEELILPTEPSARDYTRWVLDLIADLCKIEKKSASEILQSLANVKYDIFKIRVINSKSNGISIKEGIELFDEAKKILNCSANSTSRLKQGASSKGRNPLEVNEYLSKVQLGHTIRGSYILTILSPWDFQASQGDMFKNEFGREVTKNLAKSLSATKAALKKSIAGFDIVYFQSSFEEGVNSSLCQSLGKLTKDCGDVDISIDWSPESPESSQPTFFSFKETDSKYLLEAASKLRELTPEENVRLEGMIVQSVTPSEKDDGNYIISASYEGKPVAVKIYFSKQDREMVLKAQNAKNVISVEGTLKKQGRAFILENPMNLIIIADDE